MAQHWAGQAQIPARGRAGGGVKSMQEGGGLSPTELPLTLTTECKVPRGFGAEPRKIWIFWHLRPQKSRQNGLSDNVLFCFFFF